MDQQPQTIDLQIDHPEVDDLQRDFRAKSLKHHVLSLIHRWPYEQLREQAGGRKILELGCNKGFGTIIYADGADSVKAVDTSPEAIEKARKYNSRENIDYVCLDSWTLPFADDSFDLTVLFQVIEHIALDKLDIFLREIRRVTRADGQVIVTTPNRNIRLLPLQKPWNRFHAKEYSAGDLEKLLNRYFAEVSVEGLFGVDALNEVERKRVRQKPGKVYIERPFKRYIKEPLRRLLGIGGKASVEKVPGADKPEAEHRSKGGETGAGSNAAEYPFSTSDLQLRDDSLREALDLRATVLRVK
jgi:SAM-dependent methyltransferase